MSDSLALVKKIQSLFPIHKSINLIGPDPDQWLLLFHKFIEKGISTKSQVFVLETTEDAEKFYENAKKVYKDLLFFSGLENSPYSHILSSENDLFSRFTTLSQLLKNESVVLITTYEALHLKVPPRHFFEKSFKILKDDIISPFDLSTKLVSYGYKQAPTVEEPGTFSSKGEIFDIYPMNDSPIRLQYFDDLIEEIYEIDKETLKTLKENKRDSVTFNITPHSLTTDENIKCLRSHLPMPGPAFKEKYEYRNDLLGRISDGILFENYPVFVPLFFNETTTLVDYLSKETLFHFFNFENMSKDFEIFQESLLSEFEFEKDSINPSSILPSPEHFYNFDHLIDDFKSFHIESVDYTHSLEAELDNTLNLNLVSLNVKINTASKEAAEKLEKVPKIMSYLQENARHLEKIFFVSSSSKFKDEINYLISELENKKQILEKISFIEGSLINGFYYPNEKLIFISEADLFAHKVKKTKTKKKYLSPDLFAEQLATLKNGDYVIHSDFGVGVYQGLETLNMGNQTGDFVTIIYEGGDKVYVPVYKLNMLQKHADSTAVLKVSNLNNKKFDQQKAKIRQSVKKLAFDLLEIQAKRKLKKGYSFSEPDHLFKEFELSFPFEETPDQLKAIDDVLEDMQSETPMDRLICGDVGFGKTEIAMRAAFKAVEDKKQVSILVPTTILAFQHYNSFVERFKNFPINIEFVSRFKTTKEVNETYKRLAEGTVDIIIGTHKLLSDKIKYHDLGLVIVDEEHRFGVGHKEKLKVLKENVDFITMTATPIPRTLQLSFLGIRDLSLIQTAPPKRQAIKTYIVKEDDNTLKTAIEKELSRGGQVFIVHNRVQDIESYAAYIKKLAPSAKLVYAHGQMSERDLEKRIADFYSGKFDILLATTIIESGIDIPRANTMIIDRADMYGLAQLHQLRGRIGRSDKKAYAYFIVPQTRAISETAKKRLKALQTYADMGSGFALASADLEIRGSGDILGAEQSGHIQSIGLELYMELLQEAIHEIQKTPDHMLMRKNVEISTPFTASIPDKYIKDPGTRLKLYKRLSNSAKTEDLLETKEEIQDIYGTIPDDLNNLFIILESRIILSKLGIDTIKVAKETITLKFNQEILNSEEKLRNNVLNFFMQRPKVYKINPDYSIQCRFKETITKSTLLEFSKYIAEQIEAC